MSWLQDKTALVTGSSRGLGAAIAVALAEKGVRVVMHYHRNKIAAERMTDRLRNMGADAFAAQADIRNWHEVVSLIDHTHYRFGGLDILINSAGSFIEKPLSRMGVEEWREQIDTNLNGTFYACKAVLPIMREQKFGRIINFAMAGADHVRAYRNVTAHAIAKTGILILTRSLAVEEAEHGVTINAISPGFLVDSQVSDKLENIRANIPMKRLGTANDVLATIFYLLSNEANYVTGANIVVSGGWGI